MKQGTRLLVLGFLTTACFFASKSWAWGNLGHKTSAQIAWDLMDAQTRSQVSTILQKNDFVESATWADQARSQKPWKYTMWYHFEKAPDGFNYLDNLKQQSEETQKNGGLIQALFVAEDILTRPNESAIDKENAMKFLIHFIGDIHQPFHTGRPEDNGGTKVKVSWLGEKLSLHHVWDTSIILLGHSLLLENLKEEQQVPLLANYLEKKFKVNFFNPQSIANYDIWMQESMERRKEGYDHKDDSEKSYTARFSDHVDERLYLAGVRIAYTVKRILRTRANRETTESLLGLKDNIIGIVGNFLEFVSLKPKLTSAQPSRDLTAQNYSNGL